MTKRNWPQHPPISGRQGFPWTLPVQDGETHLRCRRALALPDKGVARMKDGLAGLVGQIELERVNQAAGRDERGRRIVLELLIWPLIERPPFNLEIFRTYFGPKLLKSQGPKMSPNKLITSEKTSWTSFPGPMGE